MFLGIQTCFLGNVLKEYNIRNKIIILKLEIRRKWQLRFLSMFHKYILKKERKKKGVLFFHPALHEHSKVVSLPETVKGNDNLGICIIGESRLVNLNHMCFVKQSYNDLDRIEHFQSF